jgi:hypothetical protein
MIHDVFSLLLGLTLPGAYPGTVRLQHADGTVDVEFDDPAMQARGIGAIPVKHGTPETQVQLSDGQRVLVQFRAGNPKEPFVAAYEYGKDRAAYRFGVDPRPLARHGDLVEGRVDPGSLVSGIVGPPSPAVAAAIAAGAGSVLTLPPLTPFTLQLNTPFGVRFTGAINVPSRSITA